MHGDLVRSDPVHLQFEWDGSTQRLFVGGAPAEIAPTASQPNSWANAPNTLRVGLGQAASQYLNGRLAHLAAWSAALGQGAARYLAVV